MATTAQAWYVRLPDGRTVRARSVDTLRRSLRNGRVPPGSLARRSRAEQWQPLARFAELADVLPTRRPPAGNPAPAADALPSANGRGVVQTLRTALDRSFSRRKLATAAATAGLAAAGLFALEQLTVVPLDAWGWAAYASLALFVLTCSALGTVLLTRMTFFELDQHRPAHSDALRAGLARQTLRVLVGQGAVAALLIGLTVLLRDAGPWLVAHDLGDLNAAREGLIGVAGALRLLLEALAWPLALLAVLLLGPLLVIEECPLGQGLGEWLGLLCRHPGRAYLHEALALVLAVAVAFPLLAAFGIAAWSAGEPLSRTEHGTLSILAGLALAPALAYLSAANVFIYLNLRYEYIDAPRER